MIIHSPFLLTMSNAFARSTNATYSPLFSPRHFIWSCLRTNTMSVVPLLAPNPHWVSGRWSSAMVGTNLFRSTRARIFPAMESSDSLIVGAIWLFFLFLYKVMMTASRRLLGGLPCSQQQKRSSWSLLCNAGLPSFQSSGGIPSTPGTLPLLNCSMALVISFTESSSFNSALNGCWGMRRTAGSWTTRSARKNQLFYH